MEQSKAAAAPAAPPPTPDDAPTDDDDDDSHSPQRAPSALAFVVVERQRHLPFLGWRHPMGLYDPHGFEDEAGHGANAPAQTGWEVEVTAETDRDGWRYGTHFERLGVPRRGGRAAKRSTDACRARRWTYGLDGDPRGVLAAPGGDAAEDGDAVGLFLFWQMLRSTLGRRPLRDVPMDPSALYRVRKRHAAYYRAWVGERLPRGPAADADLVDLAHAFVYVRASYGFAMAEGHMDGVRVGAAMFTVRKVHFDVTEDVDDASNTKCLRELAALDEASLVHARWSNLTYRPSFFVAADHDRGWVVLAIRGTLAMRDVLTDVTASQVAFCGGHAHLGFVKCAAFVEREAAAHLEAARRKWPAYDLVLCGHSMAGSIAAILALSYRRSPGRWPRFPKPPRVFCMGGAGSLSADLADEARGFCLGAIHGKDPVARLSVVNIEALLDELVDQGLGRKLGTLLFGETAFEARSPTTRLKHAEDDAPPADAAGEPASTVEPEFEVEPDPDAGDASPLDAALDEGESQIRVPLFTPGRVVHVDWDSFDGKKGADAPFCFEGSPPDYDKLLLSYTLFGYHIPKGYCELLFELAGAYGDDGADGGDGDDGGDGAATRRALRDRVAAAKWSRPVLKGRLF